MSARTFDILVAALVISLVCFLVTGCGTAGGAISVSRAIPIACQEKEPDEPAWPSDGLVPGGTLFDAVKTLQADITMRGPYEQELRTALRACIKPLTADRK